MTSGSAPPTFTERYRAYASDWLFLAPIWLAEVLLVLFVSEFSVWWAITVFGIVWTLSLASMWSWIGHGQTPGMRKVGLRLVTDAGREPAFRQALVRAAALFLGSLLGLVQLSVLLSTDGRYFHDRVARTRLIRDSNSAKPGEARPLPTGR